MNTNCLAGMKCPTCGNEDEFRIEVSKVVKMTDDGSEDLGGDEVWGAESYCVCSECETEGLVSKFRSAP